MWAKLKRVFCHRWTLSAIGLLVIALLVWFAGDAIAIYDSRPLGSAGARIGLIVFFVLCVLAWEGWRHYRAWRANRQMLAALSGGDAANNAALSQREVAELQKRFDEALSTLRKARFDDKAGGGRNYLYQLPWYMFIGAPGSGKTTALVNSGLRFPLAEKLGRDAVKGVGGTRNCDWWFTDEAVLLDTAGRYTTQTSNREVDASAWMGFLSMLKKFRPHQPLNGALITLSISDLYVQSPEERAEYARSVRARIQELYQTLGVRFPLYVMVTKCDLMAGFSEFFSDLGQEARGQVWGATFAYQPQNGGPSAAAQFDREFDALLQRLHARVLTRMENERDPQRRGVLFAFPQQFAGVKQGVKDFLDEVFLSSAFAEEPVLRGVYFTSGTQEGTPFDRVLGHLSRAYGLERQVLPPAASSGRSYFLTRLLREVVFPESDLAGRTAQVERSRQRLALAGYAACGVLALLLMAGWSVSFVRNQSLIAQVDESANAIRQKAGTLPKLPEGDVRAALPLLDPLREMPAGYGHRDADVPLSMGLGLYQGDKLGAQASRSYLNALQAVFLPRVALRLEQQIREASTPEVRYEALKAYLMLYQPRHLDKAELEAWVSSDWDRTFGRDVSSQERAALLAHLQAALEQEAIELPMPMDSALVEEARRQLAAAPLAERAYSRLKRLGVENVPDFRVSEASGPSGALLFVRASGRPLTEGVPALFTVKGYEAGFKAQAATLVKRLAEEEAWVLGPQFATQGAEKKTAQALGDMQRLYLTEYVRIWDGVLADLRLAPTSSLTQSIQSITLLSAGDSPLKLLLQAVARETQLASSQARSAEAVAEKAADKMANAVRSTVDKLVGGAPVQPSLPKDRPEMMVDRHFEHLHRVAQAPAGSPAPLDAMLAVLKEYEVQLRATDDALKRGAPAQSDAAIVARIKSEADRMPAPLNNLLNGMISRSTGQAASGAQEGVRKALSGEVASYCKQAVEGRYPFTKGQAREVPLGDFARLFGPNGTFDAFVKAKLSGLVDTATPVWKPVKLAEGVDGLDATSIASLQRAAVIRDAFFSSGTPNPAFSADLVLLKAEEGITEVQITIDGQTTRLQAGGQSGVRLNWPSLNPTSPLRLTATVAGRESAPLSFDGPWALFRLIDAARLEGGTPERSTLSFALGDRRAVFELRSGSVRNPLRLPELAQFRCPQ